MFVCCYWLCFVVVVDVCFWFVLDGGCGVSSPGFFSNSGVTIACLNWGATIPVEREALTITVSMKQALQDSVEVGIGSSTQLAQVRINVINWTYVICIVIKML